ncbi:type II 3-dehydroquinate dehydratase [Mesonia sp. HuA40]|uniref:type II 3-dehydroquinate dehydratase n=1 Tax=Mesonia sp. HuA40 TaxID=2602761 RepID=UPI0011CCBFBA|nr:type II 3-dehydroquinate dehydratase [Mesonia sp. HuA40]TXK71064.1 type II 3-dehydroquinate dehydratase [Mesonia sp. HuA40]
MKILIINGPNLNLLGTREPQIYGTSNFENYLDKLRQEFKEINIDYLQSNYEGDLIDALQIAAEKVDAIILNAAAYSHTSIALADTVKAIQTPVVEVHISNIYARESFRHHSYLSPVCKASLSGFGLRGYAMAIYYLKHENN